MVLPVANPSPAPSMLANQPRTRSVRRVTLLAILELRGDATSMASPAREAITLWTDDGTKIADIDPVTVNPDGPATVAITDTQDVKAHLFGGL